MMKPTLDTFARKHIGTPFKWHGRVPGVGLDCSGLLVVSLREMGVEVEDVREYRRVDQVANIERELAKFCGEVFLDGNEITSGDIVVSEVKGGVGHISILSHNEQGQETLIHASSAPTVMQVIEQPTTDEFYENLRSVWRVLPRSVK
jgi:cell wall-associated NlpC family hydrolase